MNEPNIYQRAVDTFGEEAQIGQLHEEIGELMQAINKHKRCEQGTSTASAKVYNILEEIGDVEIMCAQMRCIYDFGGVCESGKNLKLAELEMKIEQRLRDDRIDCNE